MSTITVRVTQEHIDSGAPGLCDACAVALALREQRDGLVEVYNNYVVLGDSMPIPLPESARLFIDLFDDGQDVQPFEFELEVP